jgi:ABC-type transport system substrate-binding protein
MRTAFAVCLALFVTAAPSIAAQDDKLASDEHKKLDALKGSWDVAIRYKTGPDTFEDGKATCTAEWILKGNVLQQTYQSTFMGEPFTVVQMLGYAKDRKKYFEVKFDSMDTDLMHNEGTVSDDGKTLTFKGQRTLPGTQIVTAMRTVYTLGNPDQFTVDWYMNDSGGKEEKVVTLVHTRKK